MFVKRRAYCLFAGCIAATVVCITSSSSAYAQQKPPASATQAARPAQIDRNGTLILIRTTLIALDQANKTGNYTVLHALCAPGFQSSNPPERLAEIFSRHRAQGLDLSGVVVIEPQLTLLPQIEPNGMLHMAGFFPSVPSQVYFEFLFEAVEGRWKPFGISVDLRSSAPQAPVQTTKPPHPTPPTAQRPAPIPTPTPAPRKPK